MYYFMAEQSCFRSNLQYCLTRTDVFFKLRNKIYTWWQQFAAPNNIPSLLASHNPTTEPMSPINGPKFAGVFRAISPQNDWEKPEQEEIDDDVEGEQETFVGPDATKDEGESEEAKVNRFKASVLNVSKGVSDSTDEEYQRYVPRWVFISEIHAALQ
jgi:hypothetical protein